MPNQESNQGPFGAQDNTQLTKPQQPGRSCTFINLVPTSTLKDVQCCNLGKTSSSKKQVRATEKYPSLSRSDFLHAATAPEKIVPLPKGLCRRRPVASALLGLLCEDASGAHLQVDGWVTVLSAALRSAGPSAAATPRQRSSHQRPGKGDTLSRDRAPHSTGRQLWSQQASEEGRLGSWVCSEHWLCVHSLLPEADQSQPKLVRKLCRLAGQFPGAQTLQGQEARGSAAQGACSVQGYSCCRHHRCAYAEVGAGWPCPPGFKVGGNLKPRGVKGAGEVG